MTQDSSKSRLTITIVISIILCVVVPLLNSAGLISDFTINLWGKYLCYAVLAISLDLVWGYTGLLSLGHCLFFSLGGYMLGMYLMRMIGDLGQYKMPIPDFLVFLGWTKLPRFWEPFDSFPFAALMVILVPGLVAYIFGFLAFRSRIKGVYFSILTQALTYAASLMFFRNDMLLGGNNGLTDFKFILGAPLTDPDHPERAAATMRALYTGTAILLVATYALCRWVTQSKFGKIQRAIRDSENRVLFSGYATANFKLFVFTLSAILAGMAGAFYVPQVGIINPSEMTTDKSLEVIVWVAVGGRGTLVGPVIGAIAVNALKSWASRAYPEAWLIILGVLFVLVVLFLPRGLYGVFTDLVSKFKAPRDETSKPATATV